MFASLPAPKPVGPGAHIRIVSPGMPSLSYIPERAHRAERTLTELGYVVTFGSRAFYVADDGSVAGTAEERAADLMDAFLDPSVDVVLAADAGQGGRELLDHLDAAAIAANPTMFVGYCDNVFVNLFLATQVGLSSLYGCTFMIHIGETGGAYPETIHYFNQALSAAIPLVCEPMPSRTGELVKWYEPRFERIPRRRDREGGWTWLREGTGRGPLVGAEITLLPELIDCFELSLRSTVLFWDVGYHGLAPDELFKNLCAKADLNELSGMIIGAHPTIACDEWTTTTSALIEEFLPHAAFPVVVNADLSHMCPSWTVPYGEEVVLAAPNTLMFPRASATP